MKVEKKENIIILTFKDKIDLANHCGRISDFSEGFESIRGKYFTIKKLLSEYKKHNISYTNQWGAHNIPDYIVKQFFMVFNGNLSKYEKLVKSKLNKQIKSNQPFYVIAVPKNRNDLLNHELIHAYYYLNDRYRRDVNHLIDSIPLHVYNRYKQSLLNLKYTDHSVHYDEINAYLTEANFLLWSGFNEIDVTIHQMLVDTFNKHIKQPTFQYKPSFVQRLTKDSFHNLLR